MSKTNPDYVLRAQLITQMPLSLDDPDYSIIQNTRRNGIDQRLLDDLGFLAGEIIKVAKR